MARLEMTQMAVEERQAAYYALPLWKEYLDARFAWERAHEAYCRNGESPNLIHTELVKNGLLEQLRKTPEHLAAFGWRSEPIVDRGRVIGTMRVERLER